MSFSGSLLTIASQSKNSFCSGDVPECLLLTRGNPDGFELLENVGSAICLDIVNNELYMHCSGNIWSHLGSSA